MLSRATDPTAVPNSVHIGEREGNNTSGRAGVNLTVSVDVSLLVHGAVPEFKVRVAVTVTVRVRVGGGMRYLRTEKLRSFHLRPFIVLTIAKRVHYKAEG